MITFEQQFVYIYRKDLKEFIITKFNKFNMLIKNQSSNFIETNLMSQKPAVFYLNH